MSIEVTPTVMIESMELSRQFFMSPDSYSAFDLTRDNRIIKGCIEPGDPLNTVQGEYKTIRQGPGGSIGDGTDQALATTAIEDKPITIAVGITQNVRLNPLTVFDAHYDCAYDKSKKLIVAEMANPSEMTRQTVHEWGDYFSEQDHITSAMTMVMDAAKVQVELLQAQEMADLYAHADEQFPGHKNVYHVHRPNISRTYVTGLHPYVGKDRNMKPVDPDKASKVQAYMDTLAANVSDLAANRSMSKALKGVRFASLLLRSAATRTKITEGKLADFTILDVLPDLDNPRTGLKIIERHF
jgi:hypothetical protein